MQNNIKKLHRTPKACDRTGNINLLFNTVNIFKLFLSRFLCIPIHKIYKPSTKELTFTWLNNILLPKRQTKTCSSPLAHKSHEQATQYIIQASKTENVFAQPSYNMSPPTMNFIINNSFTSKRWESVGYDSHWND